MTYKITDYSYKKAKDLGVIIKLTKTKNTKIKNIDKYNKTSSASTSRSAENWALRFCLPM